MSHDNKIKVKLTDHNLKQNQQEINEYLSHLKKNKTLKQNLMSNLTENDIENILDPLDIDDILIRPTNTSWIHFSYNYNNIDFAYEQNLLESQGRLMASIRAFHNKSKAYLNIDNSILSISSDSDISVTPHAGVWIETHGHIKLNKKYIIQFHSLITISR